MFNTQNMEKLEVLGSDKMSEIQVLTLKIDDLKGEINNLNGEENAKERILKGVLLRGYEVALYALLELDKL